MSFLSNNFRVIVAIFLALSVVFFIPLATGILALVLSLRYSAWEVIVAGVAMDLLWMPSTFSISGFDSIPLMTLLAIVIVGAFEPLRRQLLV